MVTGIHPNGCPEHELYVTVTVLSSFTVDTLIIDQLDTLPNPIMFFEGGEISLTTTTTPPNIPGATYEWYLVDRLVATTTGQASGTFYAPELPEGTDIESGFLWVEVSNAEGCTQQYFIGNVDLKNNPVEVPNVFTPNGDGTNDNFTAVSIVPVDVRNLRVWDRWGNMVYDNSDGAGVWDGMKDDKAAMSDVYLFEIQYTIFGSENVIKEKGDVTLLR